MLRPRNAVVRSGLLRRRGGAHVTSKSAARQSQRRLTDCAVEDYFEEALISDQTEATENVPDGQNEDESDH
ncbi:MAG: hypothetical protein KTR32_22075 [Granulosicoccus sp.]|nr:hypothetical protein [Granulosicoccus sp.]